MAAVTGLTIVKRFLYRGNVDEEFSNTYHFKNAPPGDDPSWTVLMNDAINHEKAIFPTDVQFVRVYGYNSDDPNAHHAFVHDFTIPGPPPAGTMPSITGNRMAGDQAACVAWKTSRLNSRGKAIYLRKYFHAGYVDVGTHDNLAGQYLGALGEFGGLTQGMNSVYGGLRSRSHDETLLQGKVITYVTTRTLKRRGKRPRTGS